MDNKNNEAVDGVVASEEISLEEQQAVLEKFDQESNTRNVTGFAKGFIKWYAIAMAVFHVYTSFFGLWATIRQRAMHLLFVMPLCYLMYPAKKGGARNNPSLLDWVFAALSFVCCGYIVVNYDAIFLRGGLPNQMDIIMGCLCALLVLEAVRRVVGTQLLIIAVIFLGYAYRKTRSSGATSQMASHFSPPNCSLALIGHPAGQHPTLPVDSASTSAHDRVRSSPPLQNCSGAPNRHPEPVSVPFAGALIGFPAGDLSMCFPEQIFSQ